MNSMVIIEALNVYGGKHEDFVDKNILTQCNIWGKFLLVFRKMCKVFLFFVD